MIISKRKLEKKLKKKKNPSLANTIKFFKKQKSSFWIEIANLLASPRRKKISINIKNINEKTKPNDIIIVPGKVLSLGNLDHKIKIWAFNFSKEAKEKLKNKVKILSMEELIKENQRNIKIIK